MGQSSRGVWSRVHGVAMEWIGDIRLGLTITQLNHKVNDDDTKIRGKEYKSEKAKVLIARASGLPGVPTLGPACHVTFPIWKSHD